MKDTRLSLPTVLVGFAIVVMFGIIIEVWPDNIAANDAAVQKEVAASVKRDRESFLTNKCMEHIYELKERVTNQTRYPETVEFKHAYANFKVTNPDSGIVVWHGTATAKNAFGTPVRLQYYYTLQVDDKTNSVSIIYASVK